MPLQPMANDVGLNLSASFISASGSVLDPNGTGCLNLSGGFHDAGDHVKFGPPQSYAVFLNSSGQVAAFACQLGATPLRLRR